MARDEHASKYDAVGWAFLFIWIGIAWLTEVGLAIGLLGVAAITLGMQAIRKMSGVPVEGFWVVVGVGFAVAGAWQWFEVDKPLAPIVLIAIGVALLVWRIWPWSRRSNGR